MSDFDYSQAFTRNIGWVTETEQTLLQTRRIAIAGLGGVGGFHLLALARLGVGKFNISDLDTFELANFNRQTGANLSTLGKPKVEVLAAMARNINPEADIHSFPQGITRNNVHDFLQEADLYVDGMDFFAFEARETIFAACAELGIPAITAAPLGVGTALINFLPGRMTFEDYFRLAGLNEMNKAVHFLVGLAPAILHRSYLIDRTRIDLANHKGPSTVAACHLSTGVIVAETLKILLRRGRVYTAPHGFQFDAYRNKLAHTWRPGGNRHPLNRLAIALAKKQFSK